MYLWYPNWNFGYFPLLSTSRRWIKLDYCFKTFNFNVGVLRCISLWTLYYNNISRDVVIICGGYNLKSIIKWGSSVPGTLQTLTELDDKTNQKDTISSLTELREPSTRN